MTLFRIKLSFFFILITCVTYGSSGQSMSKPRVIITTDGEIDDECSLVRFLLYSNEWEVEGLITSSSQYHWHGHKWAGDDWMDNVMDAYEQVYPNLIKHSIEYPTPAFLKSKTFLGNIETEGEMERVTPGSTHIVNVLLDESDNRPIWIQAWGGTNTIARALKTIQEEHPGKMEQVAKKIRFFFIWEQDDTYQKYIRPHWEKYNILTIISDQFIAYFYHWKKYLPKDQQTFFKGEWMRAHILENHGALTGAYKAHENGDLRSEGDSPAFLYMIPNGLQDFEHPDWGGWGGRYVKVRSNTWLDPVFEENYQYPSGRWYGNSAWGRLRLQKSIPNDTCLTNYLKPLWRWAEPLQNDFAARADWCVMSYHEANHPPIVSLNHPAELYATPKQQIALSAKGSSDPDGDQLSFRWWVYREAGNCADPITFDDTYSSETLFIVPEHAKTGDVIHLICEVSDNGTPALTRYRRVVVYVK